LYLQTSEAIWLYTLRCHIINEIAVWMCSNRLKLNTGKHRPLVLVHRINLAKLMLPSSWPTE